MRMSRVPILLALVATPWMASAATMHVQIQSAQLRETPTFLGRMVGTIPYGDAVTVVETRAPWSRVRTADNRTGWVHDSALSKKAIKMRAGAQDVSTAASGQELALAGKGFSSEVEADFKAKNADIDFTWIDRMEKIVITAEEKIEFLKEGGVQPGGGA